MMYWIRQTLSFRLSGAIFRFLAGAFFFLCMVSSAVWLGGSVFLPVAHARESGEAKFGLKPLLYDSAQPLTRSYFIFDIKPGSVIQSRVVVSNSGTVVGSVRLYAVDATTAQTSGAVYLNRTDPRKDVGNWVRLDTQQLTLSPGQRRIVSFHVTVPNTVRSGVHLGGIVAEKVAQASDSQPQKKNAPLIHVTTRTVVAVQANLPGTPVEQMAGAGIQAGGQNGYQQLLVGLSNIGTEMLKPSGTLQVADSQGHILKEMTLKLDTFLPHTSIHYPVAIKGQALLPDTYRAILTLTYHSHVLHYSTQFAITRQQVEQAFSAPGSKTQLSSGLLDTILSPWVLGGGGLLLIFLFVAVGTILYRMGRSRA
jgi:hypothetical protein